MRQSGLAGLVDKQPGVKPTKDPKDRVIEQLEAKNARLEKKLRISRHLIDMQIKAHEILGIALPIIEETSDADSWRSSNNTESWAGLAVRSSNVVTTSRPKGSEGRHGCYYTLR